NEIVEQLTAMADALVGRQQKAVAYRHLSRVLQNIEKGLGKGNLALLEGKEYVPYRAAEAFLGISRRQLQRLIESGAIVLKKGNSYVKLVSTASIFQYADRPNPHGPYVRKEI